MLEDDRDVAAYRDAVLWHGALIRLTPGETTRVCKKVLSKGATDVARVMIGFGLFVVDREGWALLAVPRDKGCVKTVGVALRAAGLKAVADRIVRAAKK